MSQDELVDLWQKGAMDSLELAEAALEMHKSALALFHCHLAIEKQMKALYLQENDEAAPYTHNLLELARLLSREFSDSEKEQLATLSEFAVRGRYEDIEWSAENVSQELAADWIARTKELLPKLTP